MAMIYATTNDLISFWRPMSASELEKAQRLIDSVSAEIRLRADKQGKNFDEMVEDSNDLALVTRSIICKVVAETMNKDVNQPSLSQFSESAGGYSISGTYYSASLGTFLSRTDWKRLGLGAQRYGGLDLYGNAKGHHSNSYD